MQRSTNNILMTGCCGFIGSNVLNYLCNKYSDYNFINIDRLDYVADINNVTVSENSNYTFYKGDICNKDLIDIILNNHNIDIVIHFAAQSHVDNSFCTPMQFTTDNVIGTHTLFDCCKRYGNITKFIHVSTDEVYGETLNGKCDENAILNPSNPYSASKACAEMIANAYKISFKLPIVIVRSNNIYGRHQYPEKLIPKFILNLLNDKKCPIHGQGLTYRNYLHVDDIVTAFETIFLQGEVNEIYNISSTSEHSVLDIYKMLVEKLKPGCDWDEWCEFVKDRDFNDTRYNIDSTKLEQLGWEQKISFEKGLDDTIDWYINKHIT